MYRHLVFLVPDGTVGKSTGSYSVPSELDQSSNLDLEMAEKDGGGDLWVRLRTPSLRVYYHNPRTEQTVWDAPAGARMSDEPVIEEPNLDAAARRLGVNRSLDRPSTLLPRRRGGCRPAHSRDGQHVRVKDK